MHAAAVWVTIAATLALLVFTRSRPVVLLLAVEVLQAVLGLAQYHLGVPVPLVALHLLGASLSVAAATNVLLAVRRAPFPTAGDASTGPSGGELGPAG